MTEQLAEGVDRLAAGLDADGINLTEQKLTDDRPSMHPEPQPFDVRVASLLVRTSAAQKRMAENFARMAERLVEMADAQAEMHKATEELRTLLQAARETA